MNDSGVTLVESRSIVVPPGWFVITDYVSVFDCVIGCRDRMAVGDVKEAYERLLQIAPAQPWPCPRGYWNDDDGKFVIVDGRHQWIAAVMLGHEYILVAWKVKEEE